MARNITDKQVKANLRRWIGCKMSGYWQPKKHIQRLDVTVNDLIIVTAELVVEPAVASCGRTTWRHSVMGLVAALHS